MSIINETLNFIQGGTDMKYFEFNKHEYYALIAMVQIKQLKYM